MDLTEQFWIIILIISLFVTCWGVICYVLYKEYYDKYNNEEESNYIHRPYYNDTTQIPIIVPSYRTPEIYKPERILNI